MESESVSHSSTRVQSLTVPVDNTAIHSGELAKSSYETYPKFNLAIPTAVAGVPAAILNPVKTWLGTRESYDATLDKLAGLFTANFVQFADKASADVVAAGPII